MIQNHPVVQTCVLGEGALQGLLVARFDRRLEGEHIHRIHQEDFCQALGLGARLNTNGRFLPASRQRPSAASGPHPPARRGATGLSRSPSPTSCWNSDTREDHALLYTGNGPSWRRLTI